MLKIQLKFHSCRDQSGHIHLYPPKYSETKLSKNDVPTDFLSLYRTFETETSTSNNESEQHNSVDQEIETEIRVLFLLKRIYINQLK